MKKILISLFILLTAFVLNAQTEGTLTVTTTTSSSGGVFAPKNILAVWIEDTSGNFVKTLLAYAETQKTHLNIWEASTDAAASVYNTVDAITGPTMTSHATRICTWNGTDIYGTLVADGTYKVWMELTDKNSTGNYSSFSFTKSSVSDSITPSNQPSFSSISIEWLPASIGISDINKCEDYKIYPNPVSNNFIITGDNITEIEIRNIFGDLIYKNNSRFINIGNQAKGIYFVKITTGKKIIVKKIIK